ncbi:MAG: CDP-alcohol phosphatidyltransferase family protein [Rubrivivax sp.]|nr:CDP-alcohol phosphatidyltransferase family protein [Rubrivivax sp.]
MNVSELPHSARPPAGQGSAPAAAPGLMRSALRDVAVVGAGLTLSALALAQAAGFGATYAVIALLWFAAGALLVRYGLRCGAHPHTRFGGANRVTLLRLAGVGLLVGLLGEAAWAPPLAAESTAALAWGVIALATTTALLDAVDGPLARRSGLASAFGARFDMETDAALTLVLSALVWQAGQAGPWVLAAGMLRYAFVAAAWVWPWLAAPLVPSRRRQTVCVVQITSLIVCLGPVVPPALATSLAAASLVLLSLSFAIDIRSLARTRHPNPET